MRTETHHGSVVGRLSSIVLAVGYMLSCLMIFSIKSSADYSTGWYYADGDFGRWMDEDLNFHSSPESGKWYYCWVENADLRLDAYQVIQVGSAYNPDYPAFIAYYDIPLVGQMNITSQLHGQGLFKQQAYYYGEGIQIEIHQKGWMNFAFNLKPVTKGKPFNPYYNMTTANIREWGTGSYEILVSYTISGCYYQNNKYFHPSIVFQLLTPSGVIATTTNNTYIHDNQITLSTNQYMFSEVLTTNLMTGKNFTIYDIQTLMVRVWTYCSNYSSPYGSPLELKQFQIFVRDVTPTEEQEPDAILRPDSSWTTLPEETNIYSYSREPKYTWVEGYWVGWNKMGISNEGNEYYNLGDTYPFGYPTNATMQRRFWSFHEFVNDTEDGGDGFDSYIVSNQTYVGSSLVLGFSNPDEKLKSRNWFNATVWVIARYDTQPPFGTNVYLNITVRYISKVTVNPENVLQYNPIFTYAYANTTLFYNFSNYTVSITNISWRQLQTLEVILSVYPRVKEDDGGYSYAYPDFPVIITQVGATYTDTGALAPDWTWEEIVWPTETETNIAQFLWFFIVMILIFFPAIVLNHFIPKHGFYLGMIVMLIIFIGINLSFIPYFIISAFVIGTGYWRELK